MGGRTDGPVGGEVVAPVVAGSRESAEAGAPGTKDGPGTLGAAFGRRIIDIRTLASFAIAAAVLVVLVARAGIDVGATARAIGSADPRTYLLAVLAFYTVFPIRAVRWRQMLVNAGWRREELPGVPELAEIIYLSFFVNCLVPAKLGDVYRAYLLRQRARLSGSKAGGTIAAERLLDLTTLLVLGGIAGLLILRNHPNGSIGAVTYPLEILCGLVVAGALGLFTMRRWSPRLTGRLQGRLRHLFTRFAEGATQSLGAYNVLLPCSAGIWVAEALRLYLVVRSLGVTLDPSPTAELALVLAIALIASLLTAIPLTPAGLGFAESGVVGALLLLGAADQGTALSIAVLDRTISYVSIVVLGLIVYLISSRRTASLSRGI